jgi:hypothetical protein
MPTLTSRVSFRRAVAVERLIEPRPFRPLDVDNREPGGSAAT